MNKAKRIFIALLAGFIILVVTWKYQNYDYTLALEDAFFKKVFLIRDKILSPKPKKTKEFVFINTGKDLALVEDTVDYGSVAISDRAKILQVMQYINRTSAKPAIVVIDVQFYYPFSIDPEVDELLQQEIGASDKVVIPILKAGSDRYKPPLYRTRYAHSDYRTFSATFNKFRILIQDTVKSIPILMHEMMDGARYRDHFLYPTCNGRLCLTAMWPTYYLLEDSVKKASYAEGMETIESTLVGQKVHTEFYNIGELLYALEGNPTAVKNFLADKVVIIGNFQEDVHVTPVGKMAGPVLIANLYLSLLNGEHIVSPLFVLLMLGSFTVLSYVAIFKKMPEINLSFKFLFSSYLTKFIKNYISYFGAMFFVSAIALFVFDIQIALFLPSLIFTSIEYIKEKKYLELKK